MKYLIASLLLALQLQASVLLTWNDNAVNETGFLVERSQDSVNYQTIANLGVNSVAYTDPSTAPSTLYYYRVSAFNGTGSSGYAQASITTPAAGDTAPTISDTQDQFVSSPGQSTGNIPFTVNDAETPSSLTVTATSTNQSFVPNSNIVINGTGQARTVNVTSIAQTTSATITLTVTDGSNVATDSFVVSVGSAPPPPPPPNPSTQTFANAGSITIRDNTSATPYPSVITVSGMTGTVSLVTVQLRTLSHTWGNDIDVMLTGPGGQKILLLSDAGTGNISNATMTFADSASGSAPASGSLVTGTFKPTNYDTTTDVFPAPAPSAPYSTTLAAFNGTNPNGNWSLYVRDDGGGDVGSFSGGWTLTITTQ